MDRSRDERGICRTLRAFVQRSRTTVKVVEASQSEPTPHTSRYCIIDTMLCWDSFFSFTAKDGRRQCKIFIQARCICSLRIRSWPYSRDLPVWQSAPPLVKGSWLPSWTFVPSLLPESTLLLLLLLLSLDIIDRISGEGFTQN